MIYKWIRRTYSIAVLAILFAILEKPERNVAAQEDLGSLMQDESSTTRDECKSDTQSVKTWLSFPPYKLLWCARMVSEAKERSHPLVGKRAEEVIEYYGYPCKVYEVTTEDGYILTLQRIPSNGTSVLLQHGLGGSSDNWMIADKLQSLAFILADLGYDVWLGNSRGSSYSQKHTKYSSVDDIEYWDFSWHESGIYDLPSTITYIMSQNGNRPLYFIGHSQGATSFMVGASTSPALNILNKKNIIAAFLLAPAAFLGRSTSPIRLVGPLLQHPSALNNTLDLVDGRIDSEKKWEDLLGVSPSRICSPLAYICGACDIPLFARNGFNPETADYANLPNAISKYPNIYPVKSILHFAQSIRSCNFTQFDYGKEENSKRYGMQTPPEYDIKSINVPTYIFGANTDPTCVPQDVQRTANMFRKDVLKELVWIDAKFFNHVDYIIARNVKELVYDKIVDEMEKLK